ncbi:MAG: hypothetical protein CVT97_07580 [Bacteroidetes bacterium HGW-Bacteroidetes-14]|nr:MAG: hypothetical protein CVT97_07580 [Bacteroidetes bacterium HGW-Bacteroidetes-14]
MIAAVVALFALALLFVISAVEMAFASCNRLRLELDMKQEKSYAPVVDRLLENRTRLYWSLRASGTLFTAVFTVALFAALNPLFYRLTGMLILSAAIVVLLAYLLIISLGTILPKWLASREPDLVLKNLYWFADAIYAALKPVNGRRKNVSALTMAEEEESSAEAEIIQNALNFSEVVIKECMIPRTEVCAIDSQASPEEVIALFRESNYSRIPVYRGSIDRITGYIHSKDMLEGSRPLGELVRPIDFVTEEMGANELLTSMIKNKRSIAVVLDEYGGTAGIVTLEDLIEEIFGEISDELDKEELHEKRVGEDEFIFSARLEIKYLNREYDLELPESDEYETLGGFINFFNENIPRQGDILSYGDYTFTILKTASNRVETVRLKAEHS